MVAVSTVVRALSPRSLQRYFAAKDIALDVDWAQKKGSLVPPILTAIEGLDADSRSRLAGELERIGAMGDEFGRLAIYGVHHDRAELDALANDYERSLSVWINHYEDFRRAEDVRYTDEQRRGRQWDGFALDAALPVGRDQASKDKFIEAVRSHFGSGNVHVDIFDRRRVGRGNVMSIRGVRACDSCDNCDRSRP